ncbi:hypothetical protein N7447_000412 [Penicillium robsamsonii]|uniref:uncharacterized protein n=1 Tax=Penicillium robsamsonii TaxID=1792511 RepID=UPI0025477247|nr:uncharacterized protein N7447_000412 [Penicillium robsamsonii]KAJ5834386.1 hypothetical protein N7447_000412 [Penicillium robsamsonii]
MKWNVWTVGSNRHSSSWAILQVIEVVPQAHPTRGPPGYIILQIPSEFSRAPRSLINDGDVLHLIGTTLYSC